ncbi:MAG TPA: ATP-dependent zinc metalloprotease FtsH [Tissierellia bacterium]|nr:ATP-dependent zinc metalloprotease FtsH [Tissierellia bacterium]
MKQPIENNPKQNPPEQNPGSTETPSQAAPQGPSIFNILLVTFLITFLLNNFVLGQARDVVPEISYSQFLDLVESDSIAKVLLEEDKLTLELSPQADQTIVGRIIDPTGETSVPATGATYFTARVFDPDLIERLDQADISFHQPYIKPSSPLAGFIASWIVPTLLLYLVYFFFVRKAVKKMAQGGGMGGMFSVGKSKAKEYHFEKNTGVSFEDVAGQDEAKESLMEMVDILKNPKKYLAIGAKQPKGALLVGPPGTGKTLLAKAVAGEAGVPFYSIAGSEFIEMFVGVGASRVRDMFQEAKKHAPCIIFIDEIDAIGRSRDRQLGSNDEREQTLNQLLTEMDGFSQRDNVIVLAATNRPEILDQALLRPGRFDRRIIVEKPDLIGREAVLRVHAKEVKLDPEVDLASIALMTPGATGADLANMVNEAALLAVKAGRPCVSQQDLQEAVEVVIAGKEKKDRVMNEKERRMVAYHEVGHALVSALQKNAQPVQKITIVPRTMGSLGYTMNMPEEERYLMTRSEILEHIMILLGGRAAERIVFGEVSTGAANDIERATKLARSMVTQYGMSETFGPIGLETQTSQYLDNRQVAEYSGETGTRIDREVAQILKTAEAKATELLSANQAPLERIARFLMEKENISGEEFMVLLTSDEAIPQ